jgi:protein SCO1
MRRSLPRTYRSAVRHSQGLPRTGSKGLTPSVNWPVKPLPACISTAGFLAIVLYFAGCHGQGAPNAAPGTSARTYHIRGIVVASDAKTGEVTLDTDAIPGYMGAMTMPYQLKQQEIASELHRGDTITATMTPENGNDVLDEIVVVAQAKPDYKPAVTYNDPEPGEAVPDFRFLNQSNRWISLRQFHGKVLLLTFIYTRCPLPNFCVRMSRNFAEIDKELEKDPVLAAKTHLLSVSFDPQYDTPQVLRSYGGAYTGKYTQETFAYWDFAAPAEKDLPKVLEFFDVGATPETPQTITHSLSTVVIAPDGKLYKWYPGNRWTVDQAMADVRKLTG